jgi:two-component system, LytTR family, response regulator
MNLKVLIADDESEASALLNHFLQEMDACCSISMVSDGHSAMEALKQHDFDLVFLDIKMPGCSGIDILKSLPASNFPAVILTTAFEKHAITAFDHNAVDYLLKPFNKARFRKAFDKALDHVRLKQLKSGSSHLATIFIKKGAKTVLLPVDEVEMFQASGEYIAVFNAAGSYLFTSTLNELERSLDPAVFIRVHKSTIVNTHFIARVEGHASGDLTIVTKSGKEIRASRNYKERIRQFLGKS